MSKMSNLEYNVTQALHCLDKLDDKKLTIAYLSLAVIEVRDLQRLLRELTQD